MDGQPDPSLGAVFGAFLIFAVLVVLVVVAVMDIERRVRDHAQRVRADRERSSSSRRIRTITSDAETEMIRTLMEARARRGWREDE